VVQLTDPRQAELRPSELRPAEPASGGRNVYGVPVGILMLESRFPRIVGDAGNAETWPFPVLYKVVRDASPSEIVRRLDVGEMLPPFLNAARELERAGVQLITTNCGVLLQMHAELQRNLGVPLLSSSLLQVPWVAATLPPGRKVGLLTIERASLTDAHLRAAGIPPELPLVVRGLEEFGGYFTEQILGDHPDLDVDRCRREHELAARSMLQEDPSIGAIVLECTNMPPYADAIRRTTQLPVYDLTTLLAWGVTAARQSQPRA
jgi:aspartate/glutamate racemase